MKLHANSLEVFAQLGDLRGKGRRLRQGYANAQGQRDDAAPWRRARALPAQAVAAVLLASHLLAVPAADGPPLRPAEQRLVLVRLRLLDAAAQPAVLPDERPGRRRRRPRQPAKGRGAPRHPCSAAGASVGGGLVLRGAGAVPAGVRVLVRRGAMRALVRGRLRRQLAVQLRPEAEQQLRATRPDLSVRLHARDTAQARRVARPLAPVRRTPCDGERAVTPPLPVRAVSAAAAGSTTCRCRRVARGRTRPSSSRGRSCGSRRSTSRPTRAPGEGRPPSCSASRRRRWSSRRCFRWR